MENNQIRSIGDLRSEITRLQGEVSVREAELKEDFHQISEQIKAPYRILQEVGSWLGIREKGGDKKSDWFSSIAQLGVPYLLNSLIFRRSGFLVKALIALVSQKAVSGITLEKMTDWIEKLTRWIKKENKSEQEGSADTQTKP